MKNGYGNVVVWSRNYGSYEDRPFSIHVPFAYIFLRGVKQIIPVYSVIQD